MNPFKRKNRKKDESLDQVEIQFPSQEEPAKEKPHSPYVLTPEEISGENDEYTEKIEISPFEKLKKRVLSNAEEAEEITAPQKEEAVTQEEEEETFTPSFNIDLDSFFTETEEQEDTQPQEINEEDEQLQLAFLDGVVGPYPQEAQVEEEEEESEQPEISLFQTCMPFITEGNDGQLPKSEPLYVLEKVESILGIEIEEVEEEIKENIPDEGTVVFDALKTTVISDIDAIAQTPPFTAANPEISFTKTMPVIINPENLEESKEIDISSEIFSKPIEEKSLMGMPVVDEDDSFEPDVEFKAKEDAKKVRIFLLKQRRSRFLSLSISILALIPLLILCLPAFSDSMNLASVGINVCSIICALLCVLSSIDCFKSIPSLFTSRTESNLLYCFTLVFQIVGMLVAVINELDSSICFYSAFILVLSTFFRNFYLFKKAVNIHENFKLTTSRYEKQGMILIDDAPTTFAMAHRAINGEALIATAQKTDFVKDFMKNSTVDKDLEGKVRLVFIFSAAICLLCSIAVGSYHQSFISGIISFSNLTALLCPFILFGVNTLPLTSAAKKLSRLKAAVFGIKSARKIEAANAIAIDCNALFPKGSVKLHNLNILCENDLEETIAIAAAITETIGSPLFPIFKAAMDTNDELSIPVADSIKYEERLGITGWVGDSRVFIGNRALMLAHEIEVPDMQTDKELLRKGYFPVYLARDRKACALLAVRYVPDEFIAKQLRKITNIGVTVLVNNCDQNLCEEMICDYFDLYSDSVKLMSGSGVHMYKNATASTDELNCGAVLTTKSSAVCGIMAACIKIKRSVSLLTIACVLTIVVGVVLFSYKYFGSEAWFISGLDLVIYHLTSLIVTLLAYLFTKP